jgi:transmembrane sensor
MPEGAVPPPGQWQGSPFFDSLPAAPTALSIERRRRGTRWLAVAATIVLTVGVAGYLMFNQMGDRYSTPVGGIASLPLQDGSHVTLNTASRVRVELTAGERRIDLDQGEAFFEVAKDKSRPFVVRAGNKRVIAVGTKFSVLREGDDVRVVVTEGTVRLETVGAPLHFAKPEAGAHPSVSIRGSDAGGSDSVESASLSAGTIAHANGEDLLVQTTSIPQAEDILSWRQGYLTFHETSLADAVEEFNRYNAHQIAVSGKNAASIRISGTFRPTHYQAFVRLLEDGFSIRASSDGDTTILSKD